MFEKRQKSGEPAIQQRMFGGEPVLTWQHVKSHNYFRVWKKMCQLGNRRCGHVFILIIQPYKTWKHCKICHISELWDRNL